MSWNLTAHTITVQNYLIDDTPPIVGAGVLTDDDFLQDGQDVPMPDMSGIQAAFREAYVEAFAIDYSNSLAFQLNVQNSTDAATILGEWPTSFSRPENSNAYWVTFLVGAFQPDTLHDHDSSFEPSAVSAGRFYPGKGALVFLETIRDVSRTMDWNASAFERDVVVHELGHAVSGLSHSANNPADAVTYWGHGEPPPPNSPPGTPGTYVTDIDAILEGDLIPDDWHPRFVDRYLIGIRQADNPSNS